MSGGGDSTIRCVAWHVCIKQASAVSPLMSVQHVHAQSVNADNENPILTLDSLVGTSLAVMQCALLSSRKCVPEMHLVCVIKLC